MNNGATITCEANEDRCSDGAIQSGAYANTGAVEECDDTNLTDGDGCTALCQYEEVGFTLNKQQLSFSGSLITYRISGTVSAGTGSFTLTDVLTTGA